MMKREKIQIDENKLRMPLELAVWSVITGMMEWYGEGWLYFLLVVCGLKLI